jgi:fructose-1,6-bisphosphatase I
LEDIFNAIKLSAMRIRQAIDTKPSGYAAQTNSSGEEQLELDIQSDVIIEEEFSKVPSIKTIASEEKEDATPMNSEGTYLVGYDPLDGSSLVDVNLSVGSIFGIYQNDFSGQNLVASAYVVYGPRVELVTAYKGIAKHYILQNDQFEFIQDITLNPKGKLNAPGGTQQHWAPYHKEMVDGLFASGYRLRYSGGMVPDLHQILLKGGGLFSYPGTMDKPEGKLRMVFEVFPFAYVYECAKGAAIDGTKRLLDLTPRHVHDTTPCFFGSEDEITLVTEVYGKQH